MRKFIHVDLDAFYASVAQLDHPELRGQPVIIGGSPQSRGVVMTASYEARKFGVRSAMPCAQAYRLCPQAVFHPADFKRYRQISQTIHEIFRSCTDEIEPLSPDEAYLDVTENKWDLTSAQEIAIRLKQEIKEKTGLTASAGVSNLKFVAKIASDYRKPDGLTIVPPHRVLEFIHPMPVRKLWSVGPVTHEKLKKLSIESVKDLAEYDPVRLSNQFGKHGLFLHKLANGIDNRRLSTERKAKSRGVERTFSKDIDDPFVLTQTLKQQSKSLSESLKKKNLRARTVSLKLRFNDFSTITRSQTISAATNEPEELYQIAYQKLIQVTESNNLPIRLIGISTSGFDNNNPQLGFALDATS